jgi:hypothetical protein
MFFGDVEKTFGHIVKRAAVLRNDRIVTHEKDQQAALLHANKLSAIYKSFEQPDGSLIHPLPETPSEIDIERADWFNKLPFSFQQGLLLEDVDKINEHLSSLSPEEGNSTAEMAIKSGFIQFEEVEDEDEKE